MVLASLIFFQHASAEEIKSAKQFRAGAAASNISPWMGISINGNMSDHKGTNIHDQLHARCLVLDDGENRLALVVADSCMIYRETFDEAKKLVREKTGLAPENILMSATHTHSAPAAVSIFQSDADKEYQHFLALRLADAVQQAINNLAPAKIGWGVGHEPRYVFNRRWKMKPGVINKDLFGGTNDSVRMNPPPGSEDLLEPVGPTDPDVSVLAVQSLEEEPIAVLANYSMHYCGGVPGNIYSADYFGAFCNQIEELLGAYAQEPPFVALMSNGTSGDCNSTNFREPPKKEPPYTQIQRVAKAVAEDALAVYKKMEWHDWVPLKSAQKEIMLGVRKPLRDEVEKAKERLAKANRTKDGQLDSWSPDVYARETVLLSDYPEKVPVILQTFRIGDLGIAAVPCEVFAEIGLEIKKQSPFKPTFTIELANGYNGYLPTPAQHKLGGYETWRARSSYLETDAAPKIFSQIIE
ncbi:MAG: neutral/alkaline non-lysosomal ceramidase N-terminal domain-containing protein, partial [Verrucomicrobiota bacterium]|nr:neutral/alkaline non-lysosomal ceramidase N-terminal domain-containing protein [Verrucomicrobiota bacterium]